MFCKTGSTLKLILNETLILKAFPSCLDVVLQGKVSKILTKKLLVEISLHFVGFRFQKMSLHFYVRLNFNHTSYTRLDSPFVAFELV